VGNLILHPVGVGSGLEVGRAIESYRGLGRRRMGRLLTDRRSMGR
jgi:hypothetical protein